MVCIYRLDEDVEKEEMSLFAPGKSVIKKLQTVAPANAPLAPKLKLLEGLPSSKPYEVLVRLYIIKVCHLTHFLCTVNGKIIIS